MSTEYCQVCGCVVPFCKHTDGHEDLHQEMAEAAMMMCGVDPQPARKKAQYKMRDPQIVPAITLWPQRPDLQGKFVAKGLVAFRQDDGEELAFPEGRTRTSLLVEINIVEGYIETLNSIYWIV
jgi:hypothetical protein